MIEDNNEFTNESKILNNNAHKNPSTLNPGTSALTMSITIALITKVNNPSVRIVIGNVSIIRIGFSTALIIPRTRAVINAAPKPLTCTPGSKYATTTIAIALTNQLIKIPIFVLYTIVARNSYPFHTIFSPYSQTISSLFRCSNILKENHSLEKKYNFLMKLVFCAKNVFINSEMR